MLHLKNLQLNPLRFQLDPFPFEFMFLRFDFLVFHIQLMPLCSQFFIFHLKIICHLLLLQFDIFVVTVKHFAFLA